MCRAAHCNNGSTSAIRFYDVGGVSPFIQQDLADNAVGYGACGSGNTSGGDTGTNNPESKNRSLQGVPAPSIYRKAIDNLGTTKADSLPIPLLVLAGLGTALLLTAAGLAAHKRLKARPRPPA